MRYLGEFKLDFVQNGRMNSPETFCRKIKLFPVWSILGKLTFTCDLSNLYHAPATAAESQLMLGVLLVYFSCFIKKPSSSWPATFLWACWFWRRTDSSGFLSDVTRRSHISMWDQVDKRQCWCQVELSRRITPCVAEWSGNDYTPSDFIVRYGESFGVWVQFPWQ